VGLGALAVLDPERATEGAKNITTIGDALPAGLGDSDDCETVRRTVQLAQRAEQRSAGRV